MPSTIYEVPLVMMHEKLDLIVLKKLQITNYHDPELSKWKEFLDKLKYPK
jgi:CTP synthase